MTSQDLLFARMFPMEEEKWKELCDDIRMIFSALKLPKVAYEELEKRLAPGTPYTGAKGYLETEGYFYVEAGDRGECKIVFKTKSIEEAKDLLMKKLAHDVSYRCIVAGKHEEKTEWKYNTKYDYRKYWFELALYILEGNVSEHRFKAEITEYESLLNHWFKQPFWRYDTETKEFVCIE